MGKQTDEWNDLDDAEQSKRGYEHCKKLDAIVDVVSKSVRLSDSIEMLTRLKEIHSIIDPPEEVKLSEEFLRFYRATAKLNPEDQEKALELTLRLKKEILADLPKAIERHMEKNQTQEIISKHNEISKPYLHSIRENPNL